MKSLPVALLIFVLSAFATSTRAAEPGLRTIETLDVPRYMGVWYEIARFPNWFQKKCTGQSQAEYSLLSDGQVRVLNRCPLDGGGVSEAEGLARQVGGPLSPRLQVRFAPAWLAFIPAVWGDYWIVDLDDAYQLVAVSEPGREYLWILARTPQVAEQAYQALLGRLAQQGFDLGRLLFSGKN